jgi:hypothetical protein
MRDHEALKRSRRMQFAILLGALFLLGNALTVTLL